MDAHLRAHDPEEDWARSTLFFMRKNEAFVGTFTWIASPDPDDATCVLMYHGLVHMDSLCASASVRIPEHFAPTGADADALCAKTRVCHAFATQPPELARLMALNHVFDAGAPQQTMHIGDATVYVVHDVQRIELLRPATGTRAD
jgi:hypothetical protein